MPEDGAGAPGLWQAVFFSSLMGLVGAQEPPELRCHTDFEREVFCHWDVKNTTNCAEEFQLHVSSSRGPQPGCVPENRRILDSASPSCVCVISEKNFGSKKYTFSLQTGMNKSQKETVNLSAIVKPRALRNLTVTKSKKWSFILAWKKSYGPSNVLYSIPAVYQIRYSAEGQKQPILADVTEQTEHYEIFADQLLPGENYTASVRYQCSQWGTFWSDWSRPCGWRNDFEPQPENRLWWLILLTCLLVMALVSTTYCCFVRLKRKWWDEIPSPDRSSTTKDLGKKPDLVPWQIFRGDEGKGSLRKWEVCLTPEVSPVEPSLTICSPPADPGPGTQVEEEEDPILRDDALADLFQDILSGGDGTEDTEAPWPAREAPPPVLGGLCWLGGTPQKSPGGSSGSGYQNSDVAASSLAPEPLPGDGQSVSSSPYKVLLFPPRPPSPRHQAVGTEGLGPRAEGQGSSWAGAGAGAGPPQPSCYKAFSSLAGQPATGFHPPWGCQETSSGVNPEQGLGSRPPSRPEALPAPPQREAPSRDAGLLGYRPFRAAPPGPGGLPWGSSYKPLLKVFRSVPKEGPLAPTWVTPEAEREAWASAPWEEPLALAFSRCLEEEEEEEEEGSGPEGVRQGAERFLPQVSVATL